MVKEFIVLSELKNHISQLSQEERDLLEENILKDGIRNPLTLWRVPNGFDINTPGGSFILIDGHNRFGISQEHGIDFETHVYEGEFDNLEAIKDWMEREALGQRNLSPAVQSLYRGRIYNRRKKNFGGQGFNQHKKLLGDHFDPPAQKTAEILSKELNVSAPTIKRDGQYANSVETISDLTGLNESEVIETIPVKKDVVSIAKQIQNAPEEDKKNPEKLKALFTSDSEEWYTPQHIIDSVIELFGEIDLDPCSNSKVNPNVKAREYYTQNDNGLEKPWHGKVYMNPPYGRVISDWVEKVCSEYECGNLTDAILLLPARTDTAWMAKVREFPRCYVRGRLKFSGSENSAPFPNVVVYMGSSTNDFIDVFSKHGDVYGLLNK